MSCEVESAVHNCPIDLMGHAKAVVQENQGTFALVQDREAEQPVEFSGKLTSMKAVELERQLEVALAVKLFRQSSLQDVMIVMVLAMNQAKRTVIVTASNLSLLIIVQADSFHSEDIMVVPGIRYFCLLGTILPQEFTHHDRKLLRPLNAAIEVNYSENPLTHGLMSVLFHRRGAKGAEVL